jgi:uncharacterized integral membrane protein
MNFKVLFRSVIFLLMIFAVVYVGVNNTNSIDFSFPLLFSKNLHQPAVYIFFGIFAVGVLGGTLLTAGGGGRRGGGGKDK